MSVTLDDFFPLPSLRSAPFVKVPAGMEMHRVSCPYCLVGFSEVLVETQLTQKTKRVEGIAEPRRCVTCKRYFKIKPRLKLDGVKLED